MCVGGLRRTGLLTPNENACLPSGQFLAVKVLNIKSKTGAADSIFEDQEIDEIEREIDLVKSLQHPHIVAYLGRGKYGF